MAGVGTGELDRGSTTAVGPRTTGRGITAYPPVGRCWTWEGWARETASSCRVSGAVAHLSKSRRAARLRDAIADLDAGHGRPQARRRTRPDDGGRHI